MPIFKSLVLVDPEKSPRRKRESNPGSFALEVSKQTPNHQTTETVSVVRQTVSWTGLIDSEYHVEDQRKMVLVREGATIEIHGKVKTPWTNLARSIPMLSDLDCALIYDHSDHEVA